MKSIRNKLLKNFLIVIISTVAILDLLTIICLKEYYYNNTQHMLENQIESSINFYQKYFSNNKLIENIYDNVDAFWNNNDGQIEILDPNGELLMDSYGIRDWDILSTPDITKAINGEVGVWKGEVSSYNSPVMIVSKAITSKVGEGEVIGILRIIYSLDDVNKIIDSFSALFIIISIIVIAIGMITSSIIARDVVRPINKITDVAREMARGNLDIRSNITDNIEIAQLSSTLNFMGEEVEKRERLKNEFISSVSHELRTPLTSIKGWAVTLKYDCSDLETVALGLDIIEKESDRLTGMVEELLDFSKLVNGVVTLKKKEVNIKEFIGYIENYMKPRALRERKKLTVKVQESVRTAYFDENRIKQVLSNIIDNSFKFTDEDGIIEVEALKENNEIIFIISDNGSGISEEDLPRVKDKFYKGKNSRSRNGIGLSISDEIIQLHNGTIDIESKLNEGTRITIRVPVVEINE